MHPCEQIQERLPQYVADGEPALPEYYSLRAHLRDCPICRAYAKRLRSVEAALRTYPLVSPDADVTTRVIRAVYAENQSREGEWHLLPWDLWVPAVALMMALLIAVISVPPHLLPEPPIQQLGGAAENWPSPVSAWAASILPQTDREVFWAIWTGIFVTAAGVGLSLSLACWNALNTRSLDHLEEHVLAVANRLRRITRHPH